MEKEVREIYYDSDLQLEAYQLKGILQSFPMHFHEYYVIGFIDKGSRHMTCKSGEYDLKAKDMIIFNPHDQHQCAPLNQSLFDYRAINVPKETMINLCRDITGHDVFPSFCVNTIQDNECVHYLQTLYTLIVQQGDALEKEEFLLFLITRLLEKYTTNFMMEEKPYPIEVRVACDYIETHYHETIRMTTLSTLCAMSPSTLLRSFTKRFGVTPYRYLEMIRLQKAKSLLEQGTSVLDAAIDSGFCDQSHFTNFFHTFIGVSPGAYRDIFMKEGEPHDK